MIGQYISAFVIFIIFIDDWDLSENNDDQEASPVYSYLSLLKNISVWSIRYKLAVSGH